MGMSVGAEGDWVLALKALWGQWGWESPKTKRLWARVGGTQNWHRPRRAKKRSQYIKGERDNTWVHLPLRAACPHYLFNTKVWQATEVPWNQGMAESRWPPGDITVALGTILLHKEIKVDSKVPATLAQLSTFGKCFSLHVFLSHLIQLSCFCLGLLAKKF